MTETACCSPSGNEPRNDRYLIGAITGSLVAGLGTTAMTMVEEKRSGKPSELIDLQRKSARRLAIQTPSAVALPTGTEQAIAQGGHLLLSGLAGAVYAAASSEKTNPLTGGILFGLAFYAVAHWLTGPLLGVKAPEWTQGRKAIAMHTMNHLGFGLITAFAARALSRRLPRRPIYS